MRVVLRARVGHAQPEGQALVDVHRADAVGDGAERDARVELAAVGHRRLEEERELLSRVDDLRAEPLDVGHPDGLAGDRPLHAVERLHLTERAVGGLGTVAPAELGRDGRRGVHARLVDRDREGLDLGVELLAGDDDVAALVVEADAVRRRVAGDCDRGHHQDGQDQVLLDVVDHLRLSPCLWGWVFVLFPRGGNTRIDGPFPLMRCHTLT